MTKWASIGHSRCFGGQTFFAFNMNFVVPLMHGLFASRAFFEIFTIFALSHTMRCQAWYLNGLPALLARDNHRTSIIKMQVSIVFILEPFVLPLAKLAHIVRITVLWLVFLTNLNKLVVTLHWLFELVFRLEFVLWTRFVNCSFVLRFYRSIITLKSWVSNFLFNSFNNLWSYILKIRTQVGIPYLSWYGTY